MKHRSHNCFCPDCLEIDRHFANALRNWMGLPPLYQDDRTKSPNYRTVVRRRYKTRTAHPT